MILSSQMFKHKLFLLCKQNKSCALFATLQGKLKHAVNWASLHLMPSQYLHLGTINCFLMGFLLSLAFECLARRSLWANWSQLCAPSTKRKSVGGWQCLYCSVKGGSHWVYCWNSDHWSCKLSQLLKLCENCWKGIDKTFQFFMSFFFKMLINL